MFDNDFCGDHHQTKLEVFCRELLGDNESKPGFRKIKTWVPQNQNQVPQNQNKIPQNQSDIPHNQNRRACWKKMEAVVMKLRKLNFEKKKKKLEPQDLN